MRFLDSGTNHLIGVALSKLIRKNYNHYATKINFIVKSQNFTLFEKKEIR